MSITKPRVIDFWAIPKRELHNLVLVITGHLEWGGKAEQGEHFKDLGDLLLVAVSPGWTRSRATLLAGTDYSRARRWQTSPVNTASTTHAVPSCWPTASQPLASRKAPMRRTCSQPSDKKSTP
jgi:hypothetical protein